MAKQRQVWWGLVLSVLVSIGVFCWQPRRALADYQIDQYQVHVNVQNDGSAEVTQALTYIFDDDYHGVFNVQDLRGIQGANFESVTTQLNDGAVVKATAATTGANNTYQLSQNTNRLRVKLYRSVSDDDRLHVVYRYHLKGVVTNYADTADLNWKVIGTGWDVALHNVKITMQLPAKKISRLQAWTHGPLNGQTKVDRAAGKVVMTVSRNPANSFVESHLLFPTSVTAKNTRTSTANHLKAAQQQEAKLVAAANKKRRQQRLLQVVLVGLAAIVWLGTLIYAVVWLYRHRPNHHQRPVPLAHSFDVPLVGPALAQSVWRDRRPDSRALSAVILKAAANREIKIETLPDDEVQLTKLGPVTSEFLEKCFNKVGTGQKFTLSQLKKFGKHDKKGRLSKWFDRWQTAVRTETHVYDDNKNIGILNHWIGFSTAMTVFGVMLAATSWWLGMPVFVSLTTVASVVALGGWVGYLVARQRIERHTDDGLMLKNQINGFRNMLKDIGHFNTAEIGDLILWEQILPYAAAFGLAKQVANKLAMDFSEVDLADNMIVYYPIFFSGNGLDFDLSGAINDSFSGAISSSNSASSSSGSSGGFSGGSSGGFGGGSGGGAF